MSQILSSIILIGIFGNCMIGDANAKSVENELLLLMLCVINLTNPNIAVIYVCFFSTMYQFGYLRQGHV